MTVQELMDALMEIEDKSLRVIAEGCDCANPVVRVEEVAERDGLYGHSPAKIYLVVEVGG